MPLISLDMAKRHLRIDHDDDDIQVTMYAAAAESIVREYVDRPLLAEGAIIPEPNDADAIIAPPPAIAAMLLVLGDLYEYREPGSRPSADPVLPPAVRALLAPYRIWRTYDEDCDATPQT